MSTFHTIRSLESEIDKIIGYEPHSNNWKVEYIKRQWILENFLENHETSLDYKKRIFELEFQLKQLYKLKNINSQGYIRYRQKQKEKLESNFIKVNLWKNNKLITYKIKR